MKKIKMVILGLIAFQMVNAFGQQHIARQDIPPSVVKALQEARQTRTPRTIIVENSITALSLVLYKWSGHRSYENLLIALSDEVVKSNSIDPLVMAAAQMSHLAVALERQDLYWESLSILQAFSPGIADEIQIAQQSRWGRANQKTNSTIFERLQAQEPSSTIFESEIFGGEGTKGNKFFERSKAVSNLDISDDRIQSSGAYITDAIYGSFDDSFGGASQSRSNPLVQKALAGRQAESASAISDYMRNIIDDGLRGSGVGVGVGIAIGSVVPVVGTAVGAKAGAGGGFFVGAAIGAYDHYDNYKQAKENEEKAAKEKAQQEKERQQKEAREKAEKEEHERQERGKQKAREEEKKLADLELKEKMSNTGTGVDPNKVDGRNESSPYRLLELLTKFRKLINFREDLGTSRGLLVFAHPHAGVTDPGQFDFEESKGPLNLKLDQSGFTDPGRGTFGREVN